MSLSLGRNIEMNKIKEGEDIYLECLVSSRPPPTKLYFKHQVSQGVNFSKLGKFFFGVVYKDQMFVSRAFGKKIKENLVFCFG